MIGCLSGGTRTINPDSQTNAAPADRQATPLRSGLGARLLHLRRSALVVTAILALAIAVIYGVGRIYYFRTGPEGRTVVVTVLANQSLTQIAGILAGKGVVPSERAFLIRTQDRGVSGTDLKTGTYALHVNEPYANLIDILTTGAGLLPAEAGPPPAVAGSQSSAPEPGRPGAWRAPELSRD